MRKFGFIIISLVFATVGQAYDLSRVEFFLSQGCIKQAKTALAGEYLKVTTKEDRDQLKFVAAQLFMQEKNYTQAADIYRKLLIKNPSLTRVRLELGYTYFLMKEDDKARYNLRLVLSDTNLPKQVRQSVLNLLEIIRKRKSWGISVSIGLAPDTNVNMVSGRRE